MENGTQEGSVMKRKRKRETARKILEILDDKVRQQMRCSERLQRTMKGIHYRLTRIQKLMEAAALGMDASVLTSSREILQKNLLPRYPSGTGSTYQTDPIPIDTSMLSPNVYSVTIQNDRTNLPTSIFGNRKVKGIIENYDEQNVPFHHMSVTSYPVPFLERDDLQEESLGKGGGTMDSEPSPEVPNEDITASLPAGRLMKNDTPSPQKDTCRCDSGAKECHAKNKSRSTPKSTSEELQKSSDLMNKQVHSTVTFTQEPTAGGEPQEPSNSNIAAQGAVTSSSPGSKCICGGTKVIRRVCPMKKKLQLQIDRQTEGVPIISAEPAKIQEQVGSEVTVAQKPAGGGGDPQEFTDKELEHAFDEEEIPHVKLDATESLFQNEYPELSNIVEPQREYPLPYTPGQNYTSGWNPPEFTTEELDKAFDEEAVPTVELQPNERLFMLEFKDLVGDWSPTVTSVTDQRSAVTITSQAPSGTQLKSDDAGCVCGQTISKSRELISVTLQMSSATQEKSVTFKSEPEGSTVTFAQKVTTGGGEPQEFSEEELEHVFEEEEIPDVKLDPNERLFQNEYPELSNIIEPKCEYPLSYTPGQNYPGGWNPPDFKAEELEKAFDEEIVLVVELLPNERLFMMEFKDLVGDWQPTPLATPSSAGVTPTATSGGDGYRRPPPPGYKMCCDCGKFRRVP